MTEQKKEQRQENIEAGGKECTWADCEWVLHPVWIEEASKKGDFVYWRDPRSNSFAHRHDISWAGKHKGERGSSNGSKPSPELSRLVLGELEDAGASAASLAIAARLIESGVGEACSTSYHGVG